MNIQDYFEWDEYMCTGIDPTGGGLVPDFDPETGRYLDDIEEEEEAATAAAKAAAQRENVLAKVPYSTSPEELHRMRKLSKTGPRYLFFDTETTGLPYYDNISAEAAGRPLGDIFLPHDASHSRSTKKTAASTTALAVSSSPAMAPRDAPGLCAIRDGEWVDPN